MKPIRLYVQGTHCNSCRMFIEETLNTQNGIKNAKVNLQTETVTFLTNSTDNEATLATRLTEKVSKNGYSLSAVKKVKEQQADGLIWQALPIGLAFLALFFILQKSGVLNFGIGGTTTPVTSFIIGLIASVSSCLAVVGGLVLSLSATISQDTIDDRKPMLLFHVGRLLGFAFLGGALGAIGTVLGINFTLAAILGLLASSVMILLGLNLTGLLTKSTLTLPTSIFTWFRKVEHQTLTPVVLGIGTFFLPCGFTQSMQIAALSSGSFTSGFLLMFSFALGTLPVLAILSFGSATLASSKHAPLFFKSAGVVVIGLGSFALLSGLAGLGIITPLFTV